MTYPIATEERSVVVARFNGHDEVSANSNTGGDPEIGRFQPLFHEMMDYRTSGAMTEFLFFTPDDTNAIIAGRAWDIVSTSDEYKSNAAFKAVLDHAFESGLMDLLPPNIKLGENGPGTLDEYMRKTGYFCERISQDQSHEVQSALLIDKSRRYAEDAAFGARRKLGVHESIAIVGNFMTSTNRINEGQGTPVILTWGFPFANAPQSDTLSALENAQTFFTNMRKQHGLGAQFLIEVDLSDDHDDLRERYAAKPANSEKRKAFRNFILSGFYRAARNGVIADPSYNIEKLWRTETIVEEQDYILEDLNGNKETVSTPLVRLAATPQKSHIMPHSDREARVISTNDAPRDQILSHKWNEAIYRHLATQAGADKVEFFHKGRKAIMWGEFTRKIA